MFEGQSKANRDSPISLLMNLPLHPLLKRTCKKLHPCPIITSSIRGHEMSGFYHTRHRYSQTKLLHSSGYIMSEKHEKASVFFFSFNLCLPIAIPSNSSEMHANICTTTSRLIRWREANTFLVGAKHASNHGSRRLLGGMEG